METCERIAEIDLFNSSCGEILKVDLAMPLSASAISATAILHDKFIAFPIGLPVDFHVVFSATRRRLSCVVPFALAKTVS